ncbi:MAG: CIA30 family protein [Chloroflexota bacterium]
MSKFWLITIVGVLLIGCAGQVPDSVMLVKETVSTEAVSVQKATASPVQDRSGATDPPDEEVEASGTISTARASLPGIQLFTFSGGEPRWFPLDDNVMGGISNSNAAIVEPGYLSFSGTMSLENNGGFASIRSEWQTINLSDTDGILLHVLGDGNSYRLRIQAAETGREISYNGLFITVSNEWQLVYIPFEDMVPTYFGYVMDVEPVDKASIGSFGLMLSDNQPGEFELYVDWMRAVSEDELLALSN